MDKPNNKNKINAAKSNNSNDIHNGSNLIENIDESDNKDIPTTTVPIITAGMKNITTTKTTIESIHSENNIIEITALPTTLQATNIIADNSDTGKSTHYPPSQLDLTTTTPNNNNSNPTEPANSK